MSNVDKPAHYDTGAGFQVIEITRHLKNNLGNAIKYMLRAGKKGDLKEGMAKAAWYLIDEAETSMWCEFRVPKHLRWKCIQAAHSLSGKDHHDPARYLLLRMATGDFLVSDLQACAFGIHHILGFGGKDLPHGLTMAKLAEFVDSDRVPFLTADIIQEYKK